MLAISQTDESLQSVTRELGAIQSQANINVLMLENEAASASAALQELENCSRVYFLCHGVLKAREPFNAAFFLAGDTQLTLLDIVKAHLPPIVAGTACTYHRLFSRSLNYSFRLFCWVHRGWIHWFQLIQTTKCSYVNGYMKQRAYIVQTTWCTHAFVYYRCAWCLMYSFTQGEHDVLISPFVQSEHKHLM